MAEEREDCKQAGGGHGALRSRRHEAVAALRRKRRGVCVRGGRDRGGG